MLILKSPSSFDSITDPDILKLVKLRHDQLGDEMFDSAIIIEADDSISDIEQEIGFSILTNLFDDITYPNPDFVPSCEALEDHGVLMDEGSSWRTATDLISRLDT